SKFAEQALPFATQLARSSGAKLHLAEVCHETVVGNEFGAVAIVETRPAETVRSYLDDHAQKLTGLLGRPPVASVLRGPTVEWLTQHVKNSRIDLIVMMTHGRGPIARAWLGSVSDELTRAVRCPILFLHGHEGKDVPAGATGLRHILVALDGTQEAEAVLEPAMELARIAKAEVTLMRVIELIPVTGIELAPFGLPLPDPHLLTAMRTDAENYLAQVAQKLAKHGVPIRTGLAEHTNIDAAILEDVKLRGCDLIVMATHGYGGLKRLLLGSVTDKVVRHAECAVLVCHTMAPAAPAASQKTSRGTAMDSDELTTIFTTGDPNLARIVANELQTEGINATVSGENQAGLSGILDVEVLVRAWDADRARKILEEGGHYHDKPLHGPDHSRKHDKGDGDPHWQQRRTPKIT